jgi:cation diffusion facilitator CzcD-associated flavoprotein CzcO
VAAKSLLHDAPKGTFDVTLFDSQTRIGGLWPSHKDDTAGLVHPRMVANQSKHTVQFSDLAWAGNAPQLPLSWQIGQYLDRYFQTYCLGARLKLGTRVERVERQAASPRDDGLPSAWRVHTRSAQGDNKEETFDYFLVASGFFGKPAMPDVSRGDHQIPVIHSSQYRDLQSLLGKANGSGTKILVVGGQMSGVEIAGTIASHLSSAVHSPDPSPVSNPDKYAIHHITQQPVWVFPLHTSPKVGTDIGSNPGLSR